MSDPGNEPVRIPVSGELDLHRFRPSDVSDLLDGWFEECRRLGILSVRVVHGKGSGTLRQGVHAKLARMPEVDHWVWPAEAGGWGATQVFLKPPENPEPPCVRSGP